MSSFFVKVSRVLYQNRQKVIETETMEYQGVDVVLWKLNGGHVMALVKHEREFLDFHLYTNATYYQVGEWVAKGQCFFVNRIVEEKYKNDSQNYQNVPSSPKTKTIGRKGNQTHPRVKYLESQAKRHYS
jgi:hypothetical protein